MYSFFSIIPLWLKKWTNGTRLDIVKIIASLLLFVLCVIVLIKWNKVPVVRDTVSLATYEGKNIHDESISYDVRIMHPYYNFSNLPENFARYEIGIQGNWKRDKSSSILQIKEMDSLSKIIKENNLNINSDSIVLLCSANVRMNTTNFHACKANIREMRKASDYCDVYVKTYSETNDTAFACGEMIATFKETKSGKLDSIILMPSLLDSDIRLTTNGLLNWFRLEDISQCYYKLDIKSKSYKDILSSLKVDLGGAVRFSQIYPVPDRIDHSSVIYTDKIKLAHIQLNGMTFYCQLLEASGLQSVRIYLLSAFATFFLGVSLKLLLEVFCRFFKKKILK